MVSTDLNTINPDSLHYANDLIDLTILGGIKLEGLDRMRVTVKLALSDNPRPPVRHNLDLYNDTQLEKFIRKAAEKLEIGTSVIAASLAELTELLEGYRLERIGAREEEKKVKPLTEEEQQEANENLNHKNLHEQTKEDLQSTGIQGESTNVMILWYAMASRKLHDPLSVICLAKSGTGKSYLMEKVASCIPEEDIKEGTTFTAASFYHFERFELKGKVILIEDLDGAQEAMYPLRELQTKKRISKNMAVKDGQGKMRTVAPVVEGPVSVIGCTTREKIYEDNANRSILIHLDGSKEQDKRVMDYQKQHRAGHIDGRQERQIQEKLRKMQKALQPMRVIDPYAPLIDIPQEVFKPRRTLPLLLSFIEAITFYHQRQRPQKVDEVTGEVYIETIPADIDLAFELLEDVLFRKSDELSGAARKFYEALSECKQKLILAVGDRKGFTASDVRKELRIHPRTLQRHLKELNEHGLLSIVGGSAHHGGYQYRLEEGQREESLRKSLREQIELIKERVRAYEVERSKAKKPKRKKRSTTVRQSATVA